MDDLISRQAAIRIASGYCHPANIAKELAKLPSAQPQRKMGRWIIEPGIGCKCSECDFDIGNDLDFMEYVNFCPNCGADMRGGQDE